MSVLIAHQVHEQDRMEKLVEKIMNKEQVDHKLDRAIGLPAEATDGDFNGLADSPPKN
jgi:hypothetical protein